MKDQELVNALREHANWWENGDMMDPLGGLEKDLLAAADRIANQSTHILALQKEIAGLRKAVRCVHDGLYLCDPEKNTVCKKNSCKTLCFHTTFPEFADALAETPAPQLRWIPVEERLPELQSWGASTVVLGLIKSKNAPSLNKLHDLTLCVYCDNGIWSMPGRYVAITHWMPLPEPPEEEK